MKLTLQAVCGGLLLLSRVSASRFHRADDVLAARQASCTPPVSVTAVVTTLSVHTTVRSVSTSFTTQRWQIANTTYGSIESIITTPIASAPPRTSVQTLNGISTLSITTSTTTLRTSASRTSCTSGLTAPVFLTRVSTATTTLATITSTIDTTSHRALTTQVAGSSTTISTTTLSNLEFSRTITNTVQTLSITSLVNAQKIVTQTSTTTIVTTILPPDPCGLRVIMVIVQTTETFTHSIESREYFNIQALQVNEEAWGLRRTAFVNVAPYILVSDNTFVSVRVIVQYLVAVVLTDVVTVLQNC